MITRFLTTCGLLLLAGLFVVGAAEATIIGTCDPDNPGQCSKSLTLSAGNTLLTIVLSNTSPAANSGFITADAFNLPGNVTPIGGSFTTTNANFQLFTGPIGVSGAEVPGGDREFSIALNANWEGGGSPNGGIPAGGQATFTLGLTGPGLAALTEAGIFTSEAIRLRGFADGGSDKDLVTGVPEPSTLFLIGTGLVALGSRAFRKLGRRS